MEKFCQNPLCQSEAVEQVPVSVKRPSDQLRALCATCHESYVWGVQHGRISASRFGIDPAPEDKGPEPMYRIVYVIDVNAANPQQAARCAHRIMIDRASMPPVLYVLDSKGHSTRVDLSEDQGPHQKGWTSSNGDSPSKSR